MVTLTVSMPAYNSGKYIRASIESVLRQEGVDFELIVVDDGSDDHTAEVVQSINDSRVKLIKNKRNMGIGYCHNVVIRQSATPYIAHVDSDDLVLPEAFQKMVQKLESNPRFGQVHCYFFEIDEDGKLTRESFHTRRSLFLSNRRPDMDYKRQLLIQGSVINHLRTYRREVFDRIGHFNEKMRYGEDYEMALRLVDKYEIGLVPEFLYCRRVHQNNTTAMRFQAVRSWSRRVLLCHRLLKRNEINFLRQKKYSPTRLMAISLYHLLRIPLLRSFIRKLPGKVRRFIRYQIISPGLAFPYRWAVDYLSWWPIDPFSVQRKNQPDQRKRIGYYLGRFPVLSETFIQREVRALRDAGILVEVFADGSGGPEFFDEGAKALIKTTHYLHPPDENLLARDKRYFFSRNPLSYLNLLVYVVLHRYDSHKNFHRDIKIFQQAVYLAGRLREEHIEHIHSPWSDRSAFIALVAAKLLGVPYTVQARAHDIQPGQASYALLEKFENAKVVVTNCRHNQSYLESILKRRDRERIVVIREGIELGQFNRTLKEKDESNPMRILCVARLIEEKGLVYLLRACRMMREKAYVFRCEIIGGWDKPYHANYYVKLKRLHRELGLEADVFFQGAKPFNKILDAYRQADIFVLPSVVADRGTHDVTPNVLIEAMAMSLPVVTTPIGGIPEIVDDGVSGIIVPPKDPQALAEAMMRLLGSTDLRKAMGENARKRVEERFDIRKNITRYVEFFQGTQRETGLRPMEMNSPVTPVNLR